MAKTWLDLITPYQSGDHADGGDFTFSETEHYDGGTFEQTDRYHHIYSLKSADIGTDDVVITGIRVTNDEETYLYGEEGYVLEIENNPFTLGKENLIATHLGQKIIGMQFRPLSVTAQSNPLIEAGDPAYVSHKGNSYKCFITNSTFTIGQSSQLSCDAESYQGRRVQGLSGSTKAIIQARRVAKKEISTYDLEQQRFNNLVFHSFGLYRTEEVLEDGSTIEYAHDKPTLAESQNIWRQSADAFAVSNDGGVNWRGMDADGNILANVLNAIGVNAEWIKVLTSFTVSDKFSVDKDGNVIANSFNSNNANITGGSFNVLTSSESFSSIKTSHGNWTSELSPLELNLYNSSTKNRLRVQAGGSFYETNNSPSAYIGQEGLILNNSGITLSHSSGEKASILYNPLASPPKYGMTIGNLDVQNFAEVRGDFYVNGSKNRLVKTKNYGDVLLNAYETPRPIFADTGHAQIGEDGLCYIDIDSVFLETIDHTHDYRHFLTKYGQGDLWIKESNVDYFVVEGTPNLEFDWKVEAIQRDYNTYNLEKFEGVGHGIVDEDYVNLASNYLKEYERELIV